ncbi:MAG: asparagine synthase-related protein [Bacillota bacterium]
MGLLFGVISPERQTVFEKSSLIQAVSERNNYPVLQYKNEQLVFAKHKFLQTAGSASEVDLPERDGIIVVASAMLDNRMGLADLLGLKRADLAKISDSELIRRAYLQWGERCAQYLDGMFAFAVWDSNREQLFLARDQAGIGSLYYVQTDGFFAFASTQKQLKALGGKFCQVDINAISRLIKEKGIYRIPEADYTKTVHKNIFQLPPGYCGGWRLAAGSSMMAAGGLSLTKYYDLEDNIRPLRLRSNREYEEAYMACIKSAVVTAMGGQTAVASEMSSGFDSSVVSCIAANELRKSGVRLQSYISTPPDATGLKPVSPHHLVDEYPLAKLIADFNGNIDLTACGQGEGNAYTLIDDCLDWLEFPVYNFCNMGWILNIRRRAASEGAKVILNASMGNMVISCGNYGRAAGQLIKEHNWLTLTGLVANRFAHSPLSWSGFKGTVGPLVRYYKPKRTTAVDDALLWRDLCGSAERFARLDESYKAFDDYLRMYVYASIYGKKSSGMAQMAAIGSAVRDPLQSRKVFEFARSLPPEQWALDYDDRSLIRRGSVGLLPDEKRLSKSRGLQGTDWLKQLAPDWSKVLLAARSALELPEIGELANQTEFANCLQRNSELKVLDHQASDVRAIMQLAVLGRFFSNI